MKLGGILLPVLVIAAIVIAIRLDAAEVNYEQREDVRSYVDQLEHEHGLDAAELMELFSQVKRKQSVLDAIARPAERTLKWHEYRDIFIQEKRIAQGIEFWAEHEPTLLRAQSEYGVPPEVIIAILGVETRYGRNVGGFRVIDALTTLGFDYPPRAEFFRNELTEYLLLVREEGMDALEIKGSYAGAMGYGQFIPSSFRAYAVDFDEDGIRNIWSNPVDAIGSIANYIHHHGWQGGDGVVVQVEVTGGDVEPIVNKSLNLDHTVAELTALGVVADGLQPDARAALYRMEQEDHSEHWLALNNFYVITRYNRSRLYALTVHQLGQEIKARRDERIARLEQLR